MPHYSLWLEIHSILCSVFCPCPSKSNIFTRTHFLPVNLIFSLCYLTLSVQFSLVTQVCPALCSPMDCSTPGFPVLHHSRSLLKFMSIESVMPSNHLIFFPPLLLLPSVFPSIRVFSSELVLHIRGPKYWSFSFSIILFSGYSGLITFRIDWFNLFAVQGTLKSLFQHHNLNASILSLLYGPTRTFIHDYWKNIALTRWTRCNLVKMRFLGLALIQQVCVLSCSVASNSFRPHEIIQARILEWAAISSSRVSSWPRDQTCVSCIGRHILYH